jgi:hypothetical protein
VGVTHLLDILVLWRHCLALLTASALIVYLAFDERCNGLLIGFDMGISIQAAQAIRQKSPVVPEEIP